MAEWLRPLTSEHNLIPSRASEFNPPPFFFVETVFLIFVLCCAIMCLYVLSFVL